MFTKIRLIYFIFVFLTPQNNYAEILKMLKVFGKVVKFNLNDSTIDENCVQTCFSMPGCYLAFFDIHSNCAKFDCFPSEKLIVSETNPEDGLFVAFKGNLSTEDPNFCPIKSQFSPVLYLEKGEISWFRIVGGKSQWVLIP